MNTKNILFGLLIIAVFAVGLGIGHFNSIRNVTIENKQPSSVNQQTNEKTGTTTQVSQDTATSITAGMTDDQKKMLSALGIDVNAVTPAMITCAETSLGASRIAEIKKGSSLSFTEKVKLVACYK